MSDWGLESSSTCDYCGAHVSDQFRRVYGDSSDRAHRCGECDSFRRLSRGTGAGVDVAIPDPEIAPGHHGGETA
ncbi:DUF7563 family protein [Natronosalvus halobius]|uniref:DUF7563 family protein n=1 Tax=Natronosalvus halobius TaxID=2953746 RepID=UPI00209D90E7|nr:hypothetical protein [Natronosalvus halobius]USZ72003.1 hypothetical protein NGM15_01455 [Natronosalvus halobius]